jgi:tetratricopeptide (TPR) repeat protein
VNAAELQAAAEPVPGGQVQATQASREPSRSELQQAKRIVKRAHHYLRAKRYATAAAAYAKVLALDSSHVIATRALVRIHLRERNTEQALRWAQRLVELEPDDSLSLLLLGDAHALSGDAALAEQAWQRASALGSEAAGKRVPTSR